MLAGIGGSLLLAGCGSNQGSGGAGVEVPEVRVGVLAVPDTAPLYVAQREGIFAKYGLRPKLVESQLTGDNRFNLVNGPEDIHFDSWPTIFVNISEGANWVLVGEAYQTGTNSTALLSKPGSKLKSVRDLKRGRVGVNNPNGLGVMLINTLLSTFGLTKADVTYVETPFDQIGAAISSGAVDAGWLVEPYMTRAQLETGAVPLADTAAGPTLDLPQSGYVCDRTFADKNPRTVRAFQQALLEAHVRSLDRTIVERELVNYLKASQTEAALMNLGSYPGSLRAVRPQRVADLMVEQGMLVERINVANRVVDNQG